jgi:hypothetical protein
LYFLGKKSYTNKYFAACTVLTVTFLSVVFVILFMPVFKGTVVRTELLKAPFSTPAGVPLYNRQDGQESKSPGAVGQFFGRQVHEEAPQLNVTAFVDQFSEIEVLGSRVCTSSRNPTSFLSCWVKGRDAALLTSSCRAFSSTRALSPSYGYSSWTRLTLEAAADVGETIDFPEDSKIACQLYYDDRSAPTADQSILVSTKSRWGYSLNEASGELESSRLESGPRDAAFMVVQKGFPNHMHVKVNEITQNSVSTNGEKDEKFHMYYSEEGYPDNIPYRVNQT